MTRVVEIGGRPAGPVAAPPRACSVLVGRPRAVFGVVALLLAAQAAAEPSGATHRRRHAARQQAVAVRRRVHGVGEQVARDVGCDHRRGRAHQRRRDHHLAEVAGRRGHVAQAVARRVRGLVLAGGKGIHQQHAVGRGQAVGQLAVEHRDQAGDQVLRAGAGRRRGADVGQVDDDDAARAVGDDHGLHVGRQLAAGLRHRAERGLHGGVEVAARGQRRLQRIEGHEQVVAAAQHGDQFAAVEVPAAGGQVACDLVDDRVGQLTQRAGRAAQLQQGLVRDPDRVRDTRPTLAVRKAAGVVLDRRGQPGQRAAGFEAGLCRAGRRQRDRRCQQLGPVAGRRAVDGVAAAAEVGDAGALVAADVAQAVAEADQPRVVRS